VGHEGITMTTRQISQQSLLRRVSLSAFAITAGASELTAPTTGGILVGGAGTLTVTLYAGGSVTITAVAGQLVPVCATHVTAATATGLVGLI
jgi:hypothetical protein